MGLSENLRKFRIKKDLKQEDIALKVGKTKSVISNWEKGINRPDADTIILLCSILDTTPNELLDWDFINQNKSDFNSQNQKQKWEIQHLRNTHHIMSKVAYNTHRQSVAFRILVSFLHTFFYK